MPAAAMSSGLPPGLTPSAAARLRQRLDELDYGVDRVWERIGAAGQHGLERNSTVAAAAALAGADDPLATLVRCWLLQLPVPSPALERALPGLVPDLLAGGLLRADGAEVRAAVDVRPYAADDGARGWVVSDLTPGLDAGGARTDTPVADDHVLGISSASTTLTQLTVPRSAGRALDLGVGSGVQSLHLARRCASVTGTDLNPRALALTALTADLSGFAVDLRLGDLYAPVAQERFDLIVSNPPYVMSPPASAHLTYRESGREGDGLVAEVVRDGVSRLTPGGTLQVVANWAHRHEESWPDRVGSWVGADCDAFVVQREVLDVYEYIELWLADAGLTGRPGYAGAYRTWLDYFARLGVEAVGLGWINVRRHERPRPRSLRCEEWPHAVQQPVGAEIDRFLASREVLGWSAEQKLAARWRLRPGVTQETFGEPGAAEPRHIVLRQNDGLRRGLAVDTVLAAVLGACDGELPAERIVRAVAHLLNLDTRTVLSQFLGQFDRLLDEGYLEGGHLEGGRPTPNGTKDI